MLALLVSLAHATYDQENIFYVLPLPCYSGQRFFINRNSESICWDLVTHMDFWMQATRFAGAGRLGLKKSNHILNIMPLCPE